MLQPKAQCASVWLVVMFNHVQAHEDGKKSGMSSTALSTNGTDATMMRLFAFMNHVTMMVQNS